MVTQFRERVLAALGRIYGFEGGQNTTNRMDLGVISLVHDTSRESEYGSGLQFDSGFFSGRLEQDHVATGVIRDTLPVDDLIAGLGGDVSTHRAWIMAVEHWSDVQAGNSPGTSVLGLSVVDVAGVYDAAQFVLSVVVAAGWTTTTTLLAANVYRPATVVRERLYNPFYCPPGSVLCGTSAATIAAGTQNLQQHILMWIGARGARPPGTA